MKYQEFDPEKLYFTSDTHWYHANIIKYCNRPFENPLDHNIGLVENWNKIIPKDAIVFHLGDFAFTSNIGYIQKLVEKLNGNIHLIMGNHDYQNKFNREAVRSLFKSVNDYLYINVPDEEMESLQGLFLCHYPMLSWNQSQKGSWQLHGHIHSGPLSNSIDAKNPRSPALYDVGVDNNDFKPISYEDVKIKITQQFLKSK